MKPLACGRVTFNKLLLSISFVGLLLLGGNYSSAQVPDLPPPPPPPGDELPAPPPVPDDPSAGGFLELINVYSHKNDTLPPVDPKSIRVSSDGTNVYVAAHASGIAIFDRDKATGTISYTKSKHYGFPVRLNYGSRVGYDLAGIPSSVIELSHDGAHIYTSGGYPGGIVGFERDLLTGELSFAEVVFSKPFDLNITEAVGYSDGAEEEFVLPTDKVSRSIDVLSSVAATTLSPDGNHLYVRSEHSLAVFGRDKTDGSLHLIEIEQDDVNGVDGLERRGYIISSDSEKSVAVSPDGKNVYATSGEEHAIAVFERNLSTGALEFIEVYKDENNESVTLRKAHSVTVSPDNKHVYVTGSNTVAVFQRDLSTGSLTFLEAYSDGFNGVERHDVNGVERYDNVWSAAISHDGAYVYTMSNTAGAYGDAITAYERDQNTGQLYFIETKRRNEGIDGLHGPTSITVSPDGLNLYVASNAGNTLAVFRVNHSE